MEPFKPVMLPEEAPPCHAVECQQCELSKQRKRVIWGEGSQHPKIFIILDNPGSREDKEGQPFVCGTRETLQVGMIEAGLDIDEVYVSYLLKCRPVRTYNKPLAREACFSYLHQQLQKKEPKLLLGLGNVVVQALISEDTDVKSLRGTWHQFENYPITVSYHPLAVRRRPVLLKYFVEDLRLVAEKIRTFNGLS